MQDTRRTRLVLGVLLAAALALITIDYRGGAASPVRGLRSVGGAVFGTVESAASVVSRPFRGFADGLTGGGGSQAQVAALQRQVVGLRAQLSQQRLDRAAAGQLSQLLSLAGRGRYRIVTASVIAAGGAYDDSVTIDAGRADGIKPEETVLNGQGLVGTVTSVAATTSTVLLSTDASVTVGVRLAGSGQLGVVTGTGKSMAGGGMLRLQVFDVNAILHPGQQLVTFGSVGGRPYVPGVPVGVITQVEGTSGSLTKEALVRPYADDSALGVVGVVVVAPRTSPRFSLLPPVPTPSATPSATTSPSATAAPARPRRPARARPGREAEMRRAAMSAALLLVAIVLQLTVLDNIRLPFGAAPDLVLVTVVALALTGGPLEGALSGFWAGLALDIAPPATHLVGQYALVFCVVGYACGRFAARLDDLAWAPIGGGGARLGGRRTALRAHRHRVRRRRHHLDRGPASAARLGRLRRAAQPVRALRGDPGPADRHRGPGRAAGQRAEPAADRVRPGRGGEAWSRRPAWSSGTAGPAAPPGCGPGRCGAGPRSAGRAPAAGCRTARRPARCSCTSAGAGPCRAGRPAGSGSPGGCRPARSSCTWAAATGPAGTGPGRRAPPSAGPAGCSATDPAAGRCGRPAAPGCAAAPCRAARLAGPGSR